MRTTDIVVGATYRFFDTRGFERKRIVIYISDTLVISADGNRHALPTKNYGD